VAEVVLDVWTPVATLMAVTTALGTLAPEGSVTAPAIEPVPPTWAKIEPAMNKAISERATWRIGNLFLLIDQSEPCKRSHFCPGIDNEFRSAFSLDFVAKHVTIHFSNEISGVVVLSRNDLTGPSMFA
jgi:hypothetical protein